MTKELNLGNSKLTLGKANGEAMLPSETKNFPEVIHVGGEVHHALKGVSSISKPKRHPQKFEHSKGVTMAVF